jgi:sulfur carrier protein ThiS adenylyltransferase
MAATEWNPADRDLRQRDLVPPERLARCHAAVIGVGAIGRQVALQLAAMGVPAMTLYDPETVGPENLAAQAYWESDLGGPKVHATANVCHEQFPRLELHARAERFHRRMMRSWPAERATAAFCCVDAIATRKSIWEAVRETAAFFADGRLAAEVVRVLASGRPVTDDRYATTLFGAAEAYTGRCTAKATIYAASVAAGLMVGQFARWLRGLPVVSDQTLNLLAAELTVAELEG